jgi:hypothetical protein
MRAEPLVAFGHRFVMRSPRQQVLEDIKFLLCVFIALMVLAIFLITLR